MILFLKMAFNIVYFNTVHGTVCVAGGKCSRAAHGVQTPLNLGWYRDVGVRVGCGKWFISSYVF